MNYATLKRQVQLTTGLLESQVDASFDLAVRQTEEQLFYQLKLTESIRTASLTALTQSEVDALRIAEGDSSNTGAFWRLPGDLESLISVAINGQVIGLGNPVADFAYYYSDDPADGVFKYVIKNVQGEQLMTLIPPSSSGRNNIVYFTKIDSLVLEQGATESAEDFAARQDAAVNPILAKYFTTYLHGTSVELGAYYGDAQLLTIHGPLFDKMIMNAQKREEAELGA